MLQERLWKDCDFLFWEIGSISFSELKAHVDVCEYCRKLLNIAYKYDYNGPYEYDDWNDCVGGGGICEVVDVIPQGLNREDFLYYWHLAECKKEEVQELVDSNLVQRFCSEDGFRLVKSLLGHQAKALRYLVSNAPKPILKIQLDIIVKRYKELKSFLGASEFFEFLDLPGRETDLEKVINAWRLILLGRNDPETSK